MASLLRRHLTLSFFVLILLALAFHLFSPADRPYAYTTFIHDRITHSLGLLPNPSALFPEWFKFKWSNWKSSKLDQLEDRLLFVNHSSASSALMTSPIQAKATTNASLFNSTRNSQDLVYHPNGYLLLPPGRPLTPHPIHTLITRAEKKWAKKLSQNSKSLAGCVPKYRSARVNWPHLEALSVVIGPTWADLKWPILTCLDAPRPHTQISNSAFVNPAPPWPPLGIRTGPLDLNRCDWAGVEGKWLRVVCFLDYRNLHT